MRDSEYEPFTSVYLLDQDLIWGIAFLLSREKLNWAQRWICITADKVKTAVWGIDAYPR